MPSVWSAARPIDAILIKADVDQRKRMPGDEAVNWAKPEKASRVMAEYLAAFDEAGELPKAFVVARGPLTAAEVIAFVEGKVAHYKRIRHVDLVDAIPKSASGKILRRVLVERERAAR